MKRSLVLTAGLLLAGAATAHPGHADAHLPTALAAFTGLTHPLGADHLLAMLAVGLWSAAALPATQRLRGPAAFLLALLVGAVAGRMAGAPALVEKKPPHLRGFSHRPQGPKRAQMRSKIVAIP